LLAGVDLHDWQAWLPIAFALGIIGLVAAFWFSAVAAVMRRRELARLQADFAREKEDLRVRAEREKTKLVRKSQKELIKGTRRAESRANLKVAATVTAAGAVGVLMMMTSFMTLGLALLAGAGGSLGGYLMARNWMSKNKDGDEKRAILPVASRRWLRGRSGTETPK
jgi:Flp pilus assembly protein TadB